MNYIGLVNQFWQCDIEHSFNGSETRLYFYLLHTCNSLRWKNPFTHSDAHLAATSGMSVNTLKTARNRLKQAGLLEFTAGSQGRGQNHKATYKLSISDTLPTLPAEALPGKLSNFDTIPDTLSANSLTLYRRTSDSINKHKLNEEEPTAAAVLASSLEGAFNSPPPAATSPAPGPLGEKPKPAARGKKPKADLDEVAALLLPHAGPAFATHWLTFRSGPKQAKKPLSAFKLMLGKLGKYPEAFALVMLEAAIQGDWSGVENPGTAKAYAEWQAEQARRPAPGLPAPSPPASFDPNALFGYTHSAAEGLAQARLHDPDYHRYLAEEAAERAALAA